MYVTHERLGTNGRLGNQLFQVASAIGVARANEMEYVFPSWPYQKYFSTILPGHHLDRVITHTEKQFNFYEIKLDPGRNYSMDGYFQSEKYFSACADEIRQVLTLAPEYAAYIDKRYGHHFARETCSIHVRRGDYLASSEHYHNLDMQYYTDAIKRFPSTSFIVCSDDIRWCKKHFKGAEFHFIEGEKDIIDMFISSRCDHHIIANSTFSWWSAWLNPSPTKKVIAPARWFGPRYAHFNTCDLIPAGWNTI